VDKDLRHHQYRNLLVLGGSAFPTITPSNPTITLAALSLRAAEKLVQS
jgi:choline dehydrogenase-like flavoprotein